MAQTDPYFFLPFFPRNYFLGITKNKQNPSEIKKLKNEKNEKTVTIMVTD
jgi:hypothetical protein